MVLHNLFNGGNVRSVKRDVHTSKCRHAHAIGNGPSRRGRERFPFHSQ